MKKFATKLIINMMSLVVTPRLIDFSNLSGNYSDWSNRTKLEYNYPDFNGSYEEIESEWNNILQEYVPRQKYIWMCDENGNIISGYRGRWDSEEQVWIDELSTVYAYNSMNQMESMQLQYLVLDMLYSYEEFYDYDENGNKIKVLRLDYNVETENYDSTKLEIYSYTDLNEPEYYSTSDYDMENGLWEMKFEFNAVFENDLLQSSLISTYNFESEILMPDQKTDYTYNTNLLPIQEIYSEYYDEQWNALNKTEYFYNSTNAIDSVWYYVTSDDIWINEAKYIYEYDDEDYDTISFGFEWNVETSNWDDLNRVQLKYDDLGRIIDYLSYGQYLNGQFLPSTRTSYTYNDGNNKISEYSYEWDTTNLQWVEFITNDWVFDESYTMSEIVIPRHPGFSNYYYKILSYEKLDQENIYKRTEYYYSNGEFENNVDFDIQVSKLVYPNPASNTIFIEFESDSYVLEVYDQYGKELINIDVNSSEEIDVSFLKQGVYIYKINISGKVYKGKFVKI